MMTYGRLSVILCTPLPRLLEMQSRHARRRKATVQGARRPTRTIAAPAYAKAVHGTPR